MQDLQAHDPGVMPIRRLGWLLAALAVLAVGLAACRDSSPLPAPDGAVSVETDGAPSSISGAGVPEAGTADGTQGNGSGPPSAVLIPFGARWKYLDDAKDPGKAWREPDFDDTAWKEGPARLGFDTTVPNATVINDNGGFPNSLLAFYLRHTFTVADPSRFNTLDLGLIVDDGAVLYLNGKEIGRDMMPPGELSYEDTAIECHSCGPASETDVNYNWDGNVVSSKDLVAGKNVLAVEVHNSSSNSTDIGFDLEVIAERAGWAATIDGQVRGGTALVTDLGPGRPPGFLLRFEDDRDATIEFKLVGATGPGEYAMASDATGVQPRGASFELLTHTTVGNVRRVNQYGLGAGPGADATVSLSHWPTQKPDYVAGTFSARLPALSKSSAPVTITSGEFIAWISR